MKSILEFELPKEQIEYQAALYGARYQQVLREITEFLIDREQKQLPTILVKEIRSLIIKSCTKHEITIY